MRVVSSMRCKASGTSHQKKKKIVSCLGGACEQARAVAGDNVQLNDPDQH